MYLKKLSEDSIQEACIKEFYYVYKKYWGLLFAVPNGELRNKNIGAKIKRMGGIAGVSDLIFLIARHGYNALCIEMKKPKMDNDKNKGTQSKSQKEWQALVEANGSKYVICYSVEDFMREIGDYLKD